MINTLRLGNFKCFEEENIPLQKLTLLTGVNGSGKSSVIQSLLVLRQICLRGLPSVPELSLSGELIDLGRSADILFSSAEKDVISFALEAERYPDLEATFLVDGNSGQTTWTNIDEFRIIVEDMGWSEFSLLNGGPFGTPVVAGFNYLNAERYGPRKSLPVDDSHGRLFDLGKHGEYVFDALLRHQDSITLSLEDPRSLASASGIRLRDQIEVWLHEISPGVRLDIAGVPSADVAVGSFSFGREGALRSPEYRATNVGFGLSYILPVLASLLAAPRNGLVLIENPEAHLHPRGQTKMGELCARAAAAGVQVVIETHSDHVLDGCRLAVRDGILQREEIVFHYLQLVDGRAVRISPTIDSEGRLSSWPEGFFDQHRKNAARLARPKRS